MTSHSPSDSNPLFARRQPEAGEQRTDNGSQNLFLSPYPTTTNQQPWDWMGCFLTVNDTYLEIGTSNKRKSWQVQLCNSGIMFVFLFGAVFLPTLISLGTLMHPEWNQKYWDIFWEGFGVFFSFSNPMMLGVLLIFIVTYWMIIKTSLDKAKEHTIRFNRQRREVCYRPAKSTVIIYQPWEQFIVWLGQQNNFTGQAMLQTVALGMAFQNPQTGHYYHTAIPSATVATAIAQWEGIYRYMEQGVEHCPPPAEQESRQTFDQLRKQLHADAKAGKISYLFLCFWYLWRMLGLWKQPYLIAEWDQRFSQRQPPQEVLEWSKPLPEEQWAKPSEAFIRYTAQIAADLQQGKTFLDHFVNPGSPPQ